MKGVILAGGFGTRLRPFTLRLNKGMAPIYSPEGAIPQLLFPLRTLINSGIKEILIVTSRDHCGQIVELLGDGTDYNCSLTYRIQEMNRPVVGIAQALGLAENFVGNDCFAVILGDNFYQHNFLTEFNEFEKEYLMSDYKDTCKKSAIFLKNVSDPQRFGVATVDNNLKVTKIVEKPKEPETSLAVTGLYVYTPHVFKIVPTLQPSQRKELEITDINNYYVDCGGMRSYTLTGHWSDMGLPESAKKVSDFLWSIK
jgi:glucose-1-phosphate thymidylyltransferase